MLSDVGAQFARQGDDIDASPADFGRSTDRDPD
jgi:hypothetical protein